MCNPLRFAIIGCGKLAGRHAEQAAGNGKLVAVCDIEMAKADLLAEKYNANAYSSIEELLQQETTIDVIAICTPNGLHAIHSVQALKAGANVLCEKPLCISSVDAGMMIN